MGWDPMLGEASAMCRMMVSRPLSFSLPPFPPVETPGSPEYRPVSALWNKVADLNDEATALGLGSVIHFGLGVQLTQEVGGQMVKTAITEQVAEMMLEERRDTFVQSIFVPCEQPVLDEPEAPVGKGHSSDKATGQMATLRRSTRQKAQPCSVPVSKRATPRLMKAFGMISSEEPVGEQAMEAYLSSFHMPMTDKRIKAVRMLTPLDSGPALAVAA